jgi:hypothetical protein
MHLTDKGRWVAQNMDRFCFGCGAIDQHQTMDCPICGEDFTAENEIGTSYCELLVDHDGPHALLSDGEA